LSLRSRLFRDTGVDADRVMLWNATKGQIAVRALLGLSGDSVAISNKQAGIRLLDFLQIVDFASSAKDSGEAEEADETHEHE
jgi:hypothetical protein